MDENFYDLGLGKKFLDIIPKARSRKEKLDFTKMKNFCTVKGTANTTAANAATLATQERDIICGLNF